MRRCVFGVIGHVDHGKTALVRALTGMETDRLAEERRRGISIALGFAHLAIGDAVIDFIDMPGHERFVRTMVAGATGMDAALLVVAATEGIKPQTVEHAEIAGLLGLRRAVIAVSKADLVDAERAAEVGAAAAALLRRVGLEPAAAVAVSAVALSGLAVLRAALGAVVAAERAAGLAFLPVDRAFSVAGHGTVVTGTLRGAAVAAGETLTLFPGARAVRVRGLQVRGAKVAQAAPGQRVAANLRDVEVAAVRPGASLCAPGSLAPSAWLSVALRAVADAPTLANGARLRALLGTAEVEVRLRLLDRDELQAGAACAAQLHCAAPMVLPVREGVVLRLASPARTVAGGRLLAAEPGRLRRRDPAVLARLDDLARLSLAEIVRSEASRAGAAGSSVAALSAVSGLPATEVVAALAGRASLRRDGAVVTGAALEAVVASVRGRLAAGPMGREALASGLPGVGAAVLAAALEVLAGAAAVRELGGQVELWRPEAERARAQSLAAVCRAVATELLAGGLMPPDAGMLAAGPERKRALDRLVREGVAVRAPDAVQKRVVLFHRDAVAEAQARLRPLLASAGGLSVGEVGSALGITRKYSVPLLEHLDQIRFTRRVQDRRVLVQPD